MIFSCHDGFWTRLKAKMKWNELEQGLELALELSRLAFSSRKTSARGPARSLRGVRKERIFEGTIYGALW